MKSKLWVVHYDTPEYSSLNELRLPKKFYVKADTLTLAAIEAEGAIPKAVIRTIMLEGNFYENRG